MRADHMSARVELANLRGVHESRRADEICGDEAVRMHPARFELVGHDRVKRHAAVVECQARTCRIRLRAFRASAIKARKLRIEVRNRELVTICRERAEPALARPPDINVMKQQRYRLHYSH